MTDIGRIPESWLFVPCRERFLSAPEKLECADNVIFDLEDSLKPSEKDEGLKALCSMRQTRSYEGQGVYVRINKDAPEKELTALKDLDIDGFMFPKFEDTKDLDRYGSLIGSKKVVPLIETCKGIVELEHFSSDKRIYALALGGEDYCSSMGTATNDDALFLARSRIALYAKAAGKKAIDTISTEFRDRAAFERSLQKSADLGFDGKLMIHPFQAGIALDLQRKIPKEALQDIIKEFESSKEGAVIINGSLYEKPHIERLKKIIKGE
ncbi:MAG: CoA ester lyase [Lachnospiraceae bacterium]|nr:CoA ester lyase [Lachnospiraceae bacterium]